MINIGKKRRLLERNKVALFVEYLYTQLQLKTSNLKRKAMLTLAFGISFGSIQIPLVLAQNTSTGGFADICGSIEETGLAGILQEFITLGMALLVLYGVGSYGWKKFSDNGDAMESVKWSIGTILAIYIGYLAAFHLLGVDFGCILPIVN